MGTIYNPAGVQVGKGQNLAIVNRKAREYGGVDRITIQRVEWANGRPGHWGIVTVRYVNGYYAITDFVDYDHAIEWAYARRNSGKNSWYTGCTVDHNLFI